MDTVSGAVPVGLGILKINVPNDILVVDRIVMDIGERDIVCAGIVADAPDLIVSVNVVFVLVLVFLDVPAFALAVLVILIETGT